MCYYWNIDEEFLNGSEEIVYEIVKRLIDVIFNNLLRGSNESYVKIGYSDVED